MNSVFIQFEMPDDPQTNGSESRSRNIFIKIIIWISNRIFPRANPDFDKKIDFVHTWLVECDKEDGVPTREIGLNENGQVILKMPFKRNYGYWTDNNMTLNDFIQQFQAQKISEDLFEQKWVML